jgi:hypothetical protein
MLQQQLELSKLIFSLINILSYKTASKIGKKCRRKNRFTPMEV